MSELSLVKHLCNKDFYLAHRSSVDMEYLSKELHSVLRTLDAHFALGDSVGSLSVDDLSNLYFSSNRAKPDFYSGVFDALRANTASQESTLALLGGLKQNALLRDISLLAYDLSEGRGKHEALMEKIGGLSTSGESCEDADDTFVTTDLVELISECTSVEGTRWRLPSLNKALGSLRKGDFGFLFARPETGKTTFLASEVSYMAEQLARPVLWFNLEEQGTKVMLRIYQACLGITMERLLSAPEDCREEFKNKTKDNIKLFDSATIHRSHIEKLCAKYEPGLIVFDQIDKIKGFDNDREDLRLGGIYIWARELAKQYCPIIAVCQADGSGEGQRWLTMANVANAKTSKQAEADWILGIGKVNDVGYDNLRFMHLSKNKLVGDKDGDPALRHGRFEVLIEPTIARYRDL